MRRTIGEFATFLVVVLLLALYWAFGWKAAPCPEHPFLAGLQAILSIVVSAWVLHIISDRIMGGTGLVAPFAYLVLATADPVSLYAFPLHAAATLISFSIYFYLNYCTHHPTIGQMAGAAVALGGAGLFFPPALWLFPVFLATSIGMADNKIKTVIAAMLGLVFPLAVTLGILSLTSDTDPVFYLHSLWLDMTDIVRPVLPNRATTLCRIFLTAVAAILAIIRMVARLNTYRTAHFRGAIRLLYLTLSIGILGILFLSDDCPAGLITMLPVALLLDDLLGHPDHRKGTLTLLITLILVLVAERISYFV